MYYTEKQTTDGQFVKGLGRKSIIEHSTPLKIEITQYKNRQGNYTIKDSPELRKVCARIVEEILNDIFNQC